MCSWSTYNKCHILNTHIPNVKFTSTHSPLPQHSSSPSPSPTTLFPSPLLLYVLLCNLMLMMTAHITAAIHSCHSLLLNMSTHNRPCIQIFIVNDVHLCTHTHVHRVVIHAHPHSCIHSSHTHGARREVRNRDAGGTCV